MRRREIITGLVSTVVVPPVALAQQRMPLIGFRGSDSPGLWAARRLRAFHQGLGEAGYVESRNVAIEYRWASGDYDQLPALAADLVRRQVNVLVVPGSVVAALTAKAATATIPIVFGIAADPVGLGLVASLSRPGGNLTGVTSLNSQVEPKRLELLRELVPSAADVAMLLNPKGRGRAVVRQDMLSAAISLGVKLHALHAANEHDFVTAFATLTQMRIGALLIGGDAFFTSRLDRLAALAHQYAVPTIYQYREFTEAGGLMSYGSSITDQVRIVGLYTGRILKGEKSADLPVQQATRVELFINL